MKRPATAFRLALAVGLFSALASGWAAGEAKRPPQGVKVASDLDRRLAKYAPTEMGFDARTLSEKDRQLLKHLVAAASQIDEAFWRQSSRKAAAIRDRLGAAKNPRSAKLLRFVLINGGPFDRLDEFKPFYGTTPFPPGAGFYPEDLTKEQFEAYVAAHPDQKDALLSPYTVVKWQGKRLVAVPYHQEYARWMAPAARELEAAATLSGNASFTRYLMSRAKSLLTDDYFQSDCDWIDLEDNPYELVLAPYEVYEDQLMGRITWLTRASMTFFQKTFFVPFASWTFGSLGRFVATAW